ncbi:AMP-dependent synthetase/ligase [Microseira wollei]|uniref:AMP-dependent synthetase and ligase n=1 Tax=Microseira wollei NIES-4236 TaxID=2530354 RepID=A0AAV3XJP1_9CYAN|nr:long-chain fatty acid--CoA ligase [Microseira wollei]GET39702.1 AMP-dependent synthetase and ligase [Microseira wollei NIES-4236]
MLKDSPTSTPAFKLTEQDRLALKSLVDYSGVDSVPEVWAIAAQKYANIVALHDPHAKPEIILTYAQLYQQMRQFAAGLQVLGIVPAYEPPRVALFSDNCPRWLIADQGIIMAGAANVVRSSGADKDELLYILANSGSNALVVEDLKTLKKLGDRIYDLPIQLVVLLSDEQPDAKGILNVFNFAQVMAKGENQPLQPANQNRETLATLLYTSGTTGKPKGVMLSHGNLLHQIVTIGVIVQPSAGDRVLSILPTWHAYERSCEYFLLSQGCTQIYTNLRQVKQDLKKFQPQFMVGVPRLWESIYEGVQKSFREQPPNKQKLINFFLGISQQYIEARRIVQGLHLEKRNPSSSQRLVAKIKAAVLSPLHALGEKIVYRKVREATGGKIKQVISGGGSLAMHLDTFFEIIGIEVLVGYGLTETAPVVTARRLDDNLRGSAGKPLPGTEIRIVDPETWKDVKPGSRGLVLIRGPQVMPGYYRNPEATAKAINSEGWFDSGDLGWVTNKNDLVLTGRAKDTIVLTNGENIEPQPIEDACLRSPYIDQIMLVGQDMRSLGALIVPNLDALQQWAASQNSILRLPNQTLPPDAKGKPEIDLNSKPIQDLFRKELNREVQNRPSYRPDDRIGAFKLILEPFSVENGMMTQTLKIRRPVVTERYRDMIDGMF